MTFCLDLFPIEILYFVFDHLWAHEILSSFLKISDYLDSVRLSYQNYAVNFESIRKSYFDGICRHIRPHQVTSLILSNKIDTPQQWLLFRSMFSFEQFSHLRALKLIDVNDDDGSLLLDLSKLEHLVSLELIVKTNAFFLESPPSLKRLIIKYSPDVVFDVESMMMMIPFRQLHHLTLPCCSYGQLQDIFRQSPQLVSLNILVMYINAHEIDAIAHSHQRLSTLSLSVFVYVFCFDRNLSRLHLEWFLRPLHSLRKLVLVTLTDGDNDLLDAERWELFLECHLPRLIKFEFKFRCSTMDVTVLDRFRRSFWLSEHRRWFVACDSNRSCLFSVPYFAPTSIDHPLVPVAADRTTLPLHQHTLFYDRITQLVLYSGDWTLPYRYNNIQQLTLNSPSINERVVDLSKVQSLIVNNSEWSLSIVVEWLQVSMPNVNYLSLNGNYTGRHYRVFPAVSLPQIRTLDMARYEPIPREDVFNWSRLFPSVERLIVQVDTKRQIPLIIDQFENVWSVTFHLPLSAGGCAERQVDQEFHLTSEWLMRATLRFGKTRNDNFTYQMTTHEGQINALHLWIGDSEQADVPPIEDHPMVVRRTRWWQNCFPWKSNR